MKPGQSSLTAQNNAILRVHERMRPAPARILDDPYAAAFLPDRLRNAADADQQIQAIVAGWDRQFPGVGNAILVRGRYIDRCIETALQDGLRQVVILGAGFDTRALRLPALQAGASVFEVDHPDTQAVKRERIEPHAPPATRYVAIDFNRDPLGATLRSSGHDADCPTLFIWEGVSYYLPAATVDRTLAAVRRCSPPGSRIVGDLFTAAVAGGVSRMPEADRLRAGLHRIGETIRFGIPLAQIDRFWTQRGFGDVKWISARRWAQMRLGSLITKRPISEMFILIQAAVAW